MPETPIQTQNPLQVSAHFPGAVQQPLFQQQVGELIDKHWQRFNAVRAESVPTVSVPERVGAKRKSSGIEVSEKIFQKLCSTRFCRFRPEEVDRFYQVIRLAVSESRPIPIVLGHGPLKNPNNCEDSIVDWAEFFTLSQLTALHQAVQTLYKPGLSYALFLDDARSQAANEIPAALTDRYLESLRQFVWETGLGSLIPTIVSLKDFYEAYNVRGQVETATQTVLEWESNPENRLALEEQLEHAKRNLPDAENMLNALGTEAFDLKARQAAHRYRVYLQAEILSGIWDLPQFIYGRFSHHPGYWQLFTLRKGSVTQPWQGRGCLKLNANGKMEPFLMTRNKTDRYETVDWVDTGLTIKGFESIEVVTEKALPLQ